MSVIKSGQRGILDFRSSFWGHAMHGSTWRNRKPRTLYERWMRWRKGQELYTVMVHSMVYPRAGMVVLYLGHDRKERRALVMAVEPLFDPPDMHSLTLAVRDSDRFSPATDDSKPAERSRD